MLPVGVLDFPAKNDSEPPYVPAIWVPAIWPERHGLAQFLLLPGFKHHRRRILMRPAGAANGERHIPSRERINSWQKVNSVSPASA
jgi:hypothetical protein